MPLTLEVHLRQVWGWFVVPVPTPNPPPFLDSSFPDSKIRYPSWWQYRLETM